MGAYVYPGNSMASTSISGPPSNSVGNVCTVKRETGIDLEQHRRQGHWPFHSQCLECARGRSVFQHRRKRDGQRETEIQADFMFLSQKGELSTEETQNAIKTRKQIKRWLDHFWSEVTFNFSLDSYRCRTGSWESGQSSFW